MREGDGSDAAFDQDRHLMALALEMASRSRRVAPPNPWVGAVVSNGGEILATGGTSSPGGPHAEVVALAGVTNASGATLTVTLEPCSHHGRTPPCTESIVKAGIARCDVAMLDPDPRVSGAGIRRLVDAGIDVSVGRGGGAALAMLAPYVKQRLTGRPWVKVKAALTLDGRMAARDGSSKWITGAEARAMVHAMREEADIIVTGAGTVRADDPSLTARGVDDRLLPRQPRRVVFGAIAEGARIQPAEAYVGSVEQFLMELASSEVLEILVEGGPRLTSAFFESGVVDEYVLFVAPAMLGTGPSFVESELVTSMEGIWRGTFDSVDQVGVDLRIVIRNPETTDLLEEYLLRSREAARGIGVVVVE